jgi:hypothetical protein
MTAIHESYRKIGDPDDRFDIQLWQAQGPETIFDAALELVLDSLIVKNGHADKPRLQRTVESFGKL